MAKLLFLISVFVLSSSYTPRIGEVIDSFNGVSVYYNGNNYAKVHGRNTTEDGYNVGLKYQCVEFIKRYYLEVFNHKMPDASGNAKDLFDNNLADIGFNSLRGLMQFRNVRYEKPKVNDILVYGPRQGNPFGHVALIIKVTDTEVELIQQNIGLKSRERLNLSVFQGIYNVVDYDILGWLRMPS
jgi:hypothetical protein